MKTQFEVNHRLRWVFKICKDLGIDDPVHWMNSVSPSIVDQWIAYELNERDHGAGPTGGSSPEETLAKIQSLGIMP